MNSRLSQSVVFPFLKWWDLVNSRTQKADFQAALTNAIVVLPQGIAFAAIAGLPPEYGLYSAIVPVIVAALFGSSFHLVSGPTTTSSLIVFAKVSTLAAPFTHEYIGIVLGITLLAGLFKLALGLMRFGSVANFISYSAMVGFTSGAAILIGTGQLGHFFGIQIPHSATFLSTWVHLIKLLPQANIHAVAVALFTMLAALLVKRFRPRWPGMLIGMIAGSLLGAALGSQSHGLALIGALPRSLPPFSIPDISLDILPQLGPGALAIAMLGLAEAVTIARSVAIHSGQHLDNNREFIGQGLSNVVGSFFSSYASSGSFTRTGLNYDSGAKTPMAAIYSGLLLAVLIMIVAPLTAYLPMASTAGILMLVSYNLVDKHHIKTIIRTSRPETVVLAGTFFATLFVQLEFALFSGVILSLLLYLNRTSHPHLTVLCTQSPDGHCLDSFRTSVPECPQLKIVRIDGSIFFGAANHIVEQLRIVTQHNPEQCHILIIGSSINFIDVTGCETLLNESHNLYLEGRQLYLCSLKEEVVELLERVDSKRQSKIVIFDSVDEALEKIVPRMDPERCRICRQRVFANCPPESADREGVSPGPVSPPRWTPLSWLR